VINIRLIIGESEKKASKLIKSVIKADVVVELSIKNIIFFKLYFKEREYLLSHITKIYIA